jgi:hypothetical protein
MKCRQRALSVAAVLVIAGCSSSASPNVSATGGFASFAGVLGCAELVVWGSVEARDQVDEGLEVTFGVEEWVHPRTGGERTTFIADDPAVEVGAPEWDPSERRVLVVVSEQAPAARYAAAEGERAVGQWRDAGSPRLADEECRAA